MVKYNNKMIGLLLDKKLNLRNQMIEDISKIEGLDDISNYVEDIDLSDNRIIKINGIENLKNLKKLNLKNNYISEIEGIEMLKNLEYLDLSGNTEINEIPDFLNNLMHF